MSDVARNHQGDPTSGYGEALTGMSEKSSIVAFHGANVEISGFGGAGFVPIPDGMPGARYVNSLLDGSEPDGYVHVVHSDEPSINLDTPAWEVELGYPWGVEFGVPEGELGQGIETLYLAQGLAEGIRQPRGYFLMHAAATVAPSGEGHLLVGSQGYGKTVTTMALCLEQGHRLVGNDLVLMHGGPDEADPTRYSMQLIEGTKHIHVRRTAVQANEFLGKLSLGMDEEAEASDLPSFMTKVRVDSNELGIISADGTFPLAAIWHMWLDGKNQESPRIVEQPRIARSFFFSERLARHISGIIGPVMESDGRIAVMTPSFDTPSAQRQRLKAANYLSDGCKLVTGSDGSQAAELIAGHQS